MHLTSAGAAIILLYSVGCHAVPPMEARPVVSYSTSTEASHPSITARAAQLVEGVEGMVNQLVQPAQGQASSTGSAKPVPSGMSPEGQALGAIGGIISKFTQPASEPASGHNQTSASNSSSSSPSLTDLGGTLAKLVQPANAPAQVPPPVPPAAEQSLDANFLESFCNGSTVVKPWLSSLSPHIGMAKNDICNKYMQEQAVPQQPDKAATKPRISLPTPSVSARPTGDSRRRRAAALSQYKNALN